MAARQDQTMQILSICLVGLVVILGGFLIAVNRWKADAVQQAAAAETKAREAQNALATKQAESEAFLGMMGFKQFDSLPDVQKQFDADMANYGANFAETDRKYRVILETLAAEIQNSAEQESQAKKRLQEAEEQRKQEVAQKDAQIAEFKKQVDAIKSDNAKLRQTFNDARVAFEKKREELEQTLAKSRADARKQIDDVSAKLQETETVLTTKDENLKKLLEERKQSDPSFEVSDGRVTWVNQRNRTVWINLGEADSLRPQVTFSVYEQDLADAGKSEKKGSIEVVRLLDDHLAEARITGDSISDPIMPGDQLYSQVWNRGKQVHFALTGSIDIDGDGKNDVDIAKDLIALNGGVVDAVLEADGTRKGEMTAETRYLVLGEYPKTGAEQASEKRKGWKDMNKEAETIGVETITLQEFLNQMGYKPLNRTVGLGKNSDATGANSIGGTGKFRERSPYGSSGR